MSAKQWICLWCDAPDDDKLTEIAHRLTTPFAHVWSLWCAVLLSAGKLNEGGRFQARPLALSLKWGIDEAVVVAVLAMFESAEFAMTDEGHVVNWAKRQLAGAKSTSRVHKHRYGTPPAEADAAAPEPPPEPPPAENNETLLETSRNVSSVSETHRSEEIRSEQISSSSVVVPFPRAEPPRDDDDDLFLKIKKAVGLGAEERVVRAGISRVREWLAENCDLERDVLPELADVGRALAAKGAPLRNFAAPFLAQQIRARRDGRLAAQKARAGPAGVMTFVAEGTLEWAAHVAAGHKPGLVTKGPSGAPGWWFVEPGQAPAQERKNP